MSISDITVKNAAGTDVVYNADVGSAGDKIPARWSQHAASSIAGFRPSFQLATMTSGSDTRRANFEFLLPVTYTDTATSLTRLLTLVKFSGAFFMPKDATVDQWNEGFVQLGNLLVSTSVRDQVKSGFAAT